MNDYVRPSVPEQVYRDESGAVIDYGNRWGVESPPDDSYTRTSNLDRFEPLLLVAEALIDHLVSTYEVTSTPVDFDDTGWNCSTIRALKLTPTGEGRASLRFRLTDYPSVEVDSGLARHVDFPVCSCDACDETWETCAEDIEHLVLAVAAGRFNEAIESDTDGDGPGERCIVGYRIEDPAKGASEDGTTYVAMTDELRAAAALLDARADRRWQPWSRRRTGRQPPSRQ